MWLKLILSLLLALIIAPTVLVLLGVSRWQAGATRLRRRLDAGRCGLVRGTGDPAELDRLPAPVQRYFLAALKAGQPLVSAVELRQEGQLSGGRTGRRWRPFVATQWVVVQRPGFHWDARIRLAPGITVLVRDAYVAGRATMKAALLGLVPVMQMRDTPELAHSELMRFLAEAPWYPTKLLPGQGVVWDPIDDQSARATLTDGELSVSLVFEFGAAGLISGVYATGRYRAVDGTMVRTPWEARFSGYQERAGMRVPLEAEVAWVLPEGPVSYWRGRITEILYEPTA